MLLEEFATVTIFVKLIDIKYESKDINHLSDI